MVKIVLTSNATTIGTVVGEARSGASRQRRQDEQQRQVPGQSVGGYRAIRALFAEQQRDEGANIPTTGPGTGGSNTRAAPSPTH
jgi:hypothetical protein